MDLDRWDVDEARCPGGLLLFLKGDGRYRCVPCSEVMGLMYQQPLNFCAGQQAKQATREMEREYQELLKSLPSRGVELRTGQAYWIEKRDDECNAVSAEYEGGTIAPLVHALCRTSWSKDRTKALRELRTRWRKHGLERFAIRVADRSPLGWLFVAAMASGTISYGAAVAMGVRRKWKDPEWRRLADKWTWIGMGLGGTIMVGALSVVLFACFATVVVWLRA